MQHLNESARLKEVIDAVNVLIKEMDALTQSTEEVSESVEKEIPVHHDPITQIDYADAPATDPNLTPGTLVWQKSHSGDIFRSIDNTTGEVTSYGRHNLPVEGKQALGIA